MSFFKLGEPVPPQLRARVAPIRAMHSSAIVAMRAMIRERQMHARYVALLDAASRDALDQLPAGVMVDIALARAHFEACDGLRLEARVQVEMGQALAGRLHGAMLKLALRMAGAAGATPLFLGEKAAKIWPQKNDGGAMLLVQTGAAEARVELLGYTLADIALVRLLWRGLLEGNARLLLPRARVSEVPEACARTSLVYKMAW